MAPVFAETLGYRLWRALQQQEATLGAALPLAVLQPHFVLDGFSSTALVLVWLVACVDVEFQVLKQVLFSALPFERSHGVSEGRTLLLASSRNGS